jgi:hypothetical protein
MHELLPAVRSSSVLPSRFSVGPADDAIEREADRAADAIVRGHGVGPLAAASPRIQRACATCGGGTSQQPPHAWCASSAGEEDDVVHRKTVGPSAGGPLDAVTGACVDAVRGANGEPLPPDVQYRAERQFGLDLSHVRVHHDDAAATAARALSAHAFTIGRHVAFDRGAYAPRTGTGMRLLAHELAHVVQQDPTLRRSPAPSARGQPLASDERTFFEPRFGTSLAHVRVHDDSEAASSARELGATAFTYGNHVVLGAELRTGTSQRRRTLAHELAHVLQFRGTAAADRVEVGAPHSPAEHEADVAGERVLAGRPVSVTARDAAPVVRRMIPSKKCENDDHPLLISDWFIRLGVYRELLKDAKYDKVVRAKLLHECDVAEALIKGYQQCGRVNAPSTGVIGYLASPPVAPTTTGITPMVEPVPVEPMVEVPPAEAPSGMSGGGLGGGIVIAFAGATLQWALGRWLSPSPSGVEITFDDLKQVMQQVGADFTAARTAADAAAKAKVDIKPDAAPAAKADPKVDTKTDVDVDEKPEEERRSCDTKDVTCKQVPIPRKGGDTKFARRHNRCADKVTIPAYMGMDVCINGKAFDAVDAEGALWEIKAHAWSYATIYKDPKMAKRIADDIASSLYEELKIARKCKRKFKVGVRDAGLKDALHKILPGLDITVLSC